MTSLFPSFRLVNVSPSILKQRMIKDSEELDLMRKSARIADSGHRKALEVLREGMTELELASEVEATLRRNGHEGPLPMRRFDARALYGFISSGENLTKFPGFVNVAQGIGPSKAYRISASHRKIRRGDLVMVDVTGCYQGYITDIARPYVIGNATKMQKDVFFQLNHVMERILGSVKAGLSVKKLYSIGLSEAEKSPHARYFMGYEDEARGRFIGHGLGLELDEPPILRPEDNTIIKKGMTFSIEINTIIPNFGGIKIEENVVVEDKGCQNLSCIVRKLFEIDKI
jgi:Xaa-Pro aminopeptidase